MSEALDQAGCIRHRGTARYITYYEDYQEMSEKNPDKLAAFLRILEVKTTKKLIAFEGVLEDAVNNGRDIPELNLWLEISYNDFVYWSLKTMGRSSFQVADKEAENMMLAKSRVLKRPLRPNDPESPQVQYKEYLLVIENVQAKIDGKELPITGKAYEEYGNTPPVFKNIPLLQKTWDMLQKTRGDMLQKTYPPVVKNRLINKYISNPLKEKNNNNVLDDVAHADVSTTSQNTPSEKNEEEITTPSTESQEQLTTKPTSKGNAPRRSVASGKSKQSKKDVARALLEATEIAAPEKPDPATHPYNGELFMKLADFYRGTTLPESSRSNSPYMQAVNAAASLVQRKAKFEEVDKVYRFLLGLDEVKDEQWIQRGYNTDLWTVERHLTNKLLELVRLGQPHQKGKAPSATPVPAASPEDETRLVAWIREQGYAGNALQDWERFDFMTAREAKTYGWYKGILPGEVVTRISINLRKRNANAKTSASA